MDQLNSFLPTLQTQESKGNFRIKKIMSKSSAQYNTSRLISNSIVSQLSVRNNRFDDDELEQQEVKQLLDQSREEPCTDKALAHISLVGQESVKKYYKHLRIMDRVQEENAFHNLPDSVMTVMHRSATSQNIIPCRVGLVKYEGARDAVKINNMKYGDRYMTILQEGLKRTNNLEIFELNDNRITQNTSGTLLQSLSRNAKEVYLCKNRIGQIGVNNIVSSVNQKDCRIEVLDLEDNQLGNKLVIELCQSLIKNKTVQKLFLSKNYITNIACTQIGIMLNENHTLKELYLHWNQINGQGGNAIFQALTNNSYLKVLDISSNSLGLGVSCAEQFSELVQKNTDLLHVDLSFNYFNNRDTQIIAEGLNKNRTIYGFHFTGNKGYVDSKGFLIQMENVDEDQGQQQIAQRIKGCRYLGQQRIRQWRDQQLKDCCWICEGWGQHELKWTPQKSGDWNSDPTFIHLSYQNFTGLYFGKPEMGLKLTKMLPPGKITYFFSTGDNQCIANDQQVTNHQIVIPHVLYSDQDKTVYLDKMNEIHIEINKNIIDSYYDPQIVVLPRTKDPHYIPPKKKKNKIIWTFPISLFKDWKKDNEEMLNQCFEYDWNCSRITKIIKTPEDLENSKQFLRSIYVYLKDTYKHYASFNPVGDVWAIQSSVFLQIQQAIKLTDTPNTIVPQQGTRNLQHKPSLILKTNQSLDDNSIEEIPFNISLGDLSQINQIETKEQKYQRMMKAIIKPQDVDLKFIGTLSGTEKGNPRKPDRGMIRFQFMEVFVRIAEQKYLQNQCANTYCESLKYLWEDHLKQEFRQYSTQPWRDQRYWNEHCDYCLKNYRQIMDFIYFRNAKKKVMPGQKPFMCLQELQDICSLAGLAQYEHFGSSVPLLSYNKAMMTQVDELTKDRIYQMSFVEFIEAFARLAEEASLTPMSGAFPDSTEWNLQQLKDLPLHYKLESLILLCYDKCTDQSFKANYRRPDKSFFTPVLDSDDE